MPQGQTLVGSQRRGALQAGHPVLTQFRQQLIGGKVLHQNRRSTCLYRIGEVLVSIGQLAADDWFVVGAGDYNGDQKDDLLVRQYSTGTLGYYVCAEQSSWIELGDGVGMEWTVIA